ncbi:sensor histidine kinase [Candidatus Mycobacterium methanotrophicum]|uniref:GAF domain-containing protein n=1 Tax=Candidatus Mycobacterium methanotrophicum TaxID=2943498 RepID=A0ABY4QNY3_9MYCO|nr:GAF domain-containing protein [Candidatus Mycobacterium methanotrophicum]UQX11571.1 GAF domain-containing protein [Candidatus Mycobacterium methanotrophicum]
MTLHRIVNAAMELTGARYGALGIYGPQGSPVSLIYEGIDAETARRLGDLPVGEALRVDDLAAQPQRAGLGEHDPRMRAFLAVPPSVRGVAFGALYLVDDRPGRVCCDSDEVAARALASAVAIDSAQILEAERASAKWMTACREITAALLSAEPKTALLQLIVGRMQELAGAESAILLVPTEPDLPAEEIDTLVVATAAGRDAADVIGKQVPVDDSTTGTVILGRMPTITGWFKHPLKGFTDAGDRSVIVAPLRADDTVLGVIAVVRSLRQPPFGDDYPELISDFARHAAIALTLTVDREHIRELAILADRERIAHDLHDHVIQKLFAAGLDLQGTIARAQSPEIVNRLTHTVDDLQTTIDAIRTTIFPLQMLVRPGENFRQQIQHNVAELTEDRDIATTLDTSGELTAVTGELANHAEAVVTEAVSNAVRHSGARRLTVRVEVDHRLLIEVVDDGHGIPAQNQRLSGLANMARRAAQVGGECSITSSAEGGTRVYWTVPLS